MMWRTTLVKELSGSFGVDARNFVVAFWSNKCAKNNKQNKGQELAYISTIHQQSSTSLYFYN